MALVLGLLLATGIAGAEDVIIDPYYDYRTDYDRGQFGYDDSEDIPWIENETEILALPEDDNLREIVVDQLPKGMTLFIDDSRITVGEKDRVIRAWLVVRSAAGAENGTYEGYRCETFEYKVYAHATPRRDPPVTKARRPVWRFADASRQGSYRLELLKDYFCELRGTRSVDAIRTAIREPYRRATLMPD